MTAIVHLLRNADVIRVDDGPLITSFDLDEEDRFCTFRWSQGGQRRVEVVSTRELARARIVRNTFSVSNTYGSPLQISLYRLEPECPLPAWILNGWLHIFRKSDAEGLLSFEALTDLFETFVERTVSGSQAATANRSGFSSQLEALFGAFDGDAEALSANLATQLGKSSGHRPAAWCYALCNPYFEGELGRLLSDRDAGKEGHPGVQAATG